MPEKKKGKTKKKQNPPKKQKPKPKQKQTQSRKPSQSKRSRPKPTKQMQVEIQLKNVNPNQQKMYDNIDAKKSYSRRRDEGIEQKENKSPEMNLLPELPEIPELSLDPMENEEFRRKFYQMIVMVYTGGQAMGYTEKETEELLLYMWDKLTKTIASSSIKDYETYYGSVSPRELDEALNI